MQDGGKAREALLTAQNSKLALNVADVQKHIATICSFLPQYRFKSSFDSESEFHIFRSLFISPITREYSLVIKEIKHTVAEAICFLERSFRVKIPISLRSYEMREVERHGQGLALLFYFFQ